MIASDRATFIEIVLGFAELKGKQLSAPALELYWRALRHWELEQFREAAEHLLRSCEFMPTPKDFEDLRKAGRETPAEAWIEAQRHLVWDVRGYKLSPHCPELIARVIRAIGGADVIAMCEQEKLHFLERRFCEHYETMLDAEDVRNAVPQIAFDPHAGIGALLSRHEPRRQGLLPIGETFKADPPRRPPAIAPAPPREEPASAREELGF